MDETTSGNQYAEPLVPDLEPPLYPFPKMIGKYKIEGLLTRGGMSVLYLGVHPDSQEPVLIKVLLPKFADQTPFVKRFFKEAEIISSVDHPNIIRLFDSGKWENGFYIAMEFVKGSSLRKILASQPFSLKRALEVILQIAYAVCHLHSHGIIHGDLKPENILVTDSGQVKLVDFGIAKRLDEEVDSDQKEIQRVIGTPVYMSPEVLENPQNLTFQSDIYSLGIITYELALGKITHGRVLLTLAPRGMQKILNKSLQPKLEDRYKDIVDFILDVSNYIKSGQVQKDKQGSDYFFELFEQLETLQNALLPNQNSNFQGIDLGLAHIQGMSLNGLYYELFDLSPNKKAAFISETPSRGAEGVVFSAMIRTCVHALIWRKELEKPMVFLDALKQYLEKNPLGSPVHFAYFVIDQDAKTFEYFHTQYGKLLHHSDFKIKIYQPDPALTQKSAETFEIKKEAGTFQKEDRFLLLGYPTHALVDVFREEKGSSDVLITELFKETVSLSAQKQADAILRKVRIKGEFVLDEHPLCLICFHME